LIFPTKKNSENFQFSVNQYTILHQTALHHKKSYFAMATLYSQQA